MSRVLPGTQSVDQLREILDGDDATRWWLAHLDDIGPPSFEVVLPRPDDAAPEFLDLAVPHDEFDKLVWLLPHRERTPGIWWLLERAVHSVVRTIGQIEGSPNFPVLPRELGELRRYFFFYVLLAVKPHTLAFHRSLGIPPETSRRTLVDIGRKMSVHRKNYGKGGIDAPGWLTHHMRGQLYQLGRLQYERVHLDDRLREAIEGAGVAFGKEDVALSVHITDFSGPLSPTACDASFALVKPFFDTYFPETPPRIAICISWMLDPQLDEYMTPRANIIQFKNRFNLAYIPESNNRGIQQFVFGMLDAEIDELPQATSLERAVVEHIVSGKHWHGGAGWLEL
ncbi:MAG: DUF5596 domain-containing protein [Chloroflexia bacterium]|nr:DUF5596 domain-containing protein [Chloroflexia bacterium]